MYTVCVRDHFMIAHRFRGEAFGPAQRLHGATYVVDLELRRPDLDPDGMVVDIDKAGACLREVLNEWNYRNLDDVAEFAGHNTTTEFLAQAIFNHIAVRIEDGQLGAHAAGLSAMRVTLRESHVAWAAYEGPLP
ncbi:MAG: 6-carboxytetrahydropterin synthase [Candidatus Contendobacter sp.]|nr:6-carboxytetrahydropterin synthase [Candidatus Contendobacter sp.]